MQTRIFKLYRFVMVIMFMTDYSMRVHVRQRWTDEVNVNREKERMRRWVAENRKKKYMKEEQTSYLYIYIYTIKIFCSERKRDAAVWCWRRMEISFCSEVSAFVSAFVYIAAAVNGRIFNIYYVVTGCL